MHLRFLPLPLPNQSQLAILTVSTLIVFLAYTSQYLFNYIEPGPLSQAQAIWFNTLLLALWFCYYSACTVDAAPKDWCSKDFLAQHVKVGNLSLSKSARWCKKCLAIKPPRAHHCKICGICIPKMDHHCPWTANCVSHLTFPHFFRFVTYSVICMLILAYHLSVRVSVLWRQRLAPAYLGPPEWALAHLLILFATNSVILFALLILLCRIIYGAFTNTTMIESWEIERHEVLVNRCRKSGGFLYAAGGHKIRVEHQEFPYDIGIWKNLSQAMGTKNIFIWFSPFGGAPTIDSAIYWEVNGFEDDDKVWPPPDPDKTSHSFHMKDASTPRECGGIDDGITAFKIRQENDFRRRGYKRYSSSDETYNDFSKISIENTYEYETGIDGKFGWTNTDGDRLRDYGVDEEID